MYIDLKKSEMSDVGNLPGSCEAPPKLALCVLRQITNQPKLPTLPKNLHKLRPCVLHTLYRLHF